MKKHTYEEVYNYFKDQGCTLLETEYIDSKTKMQYICKCGNKNSSILTNFKKINGCKNCVYLKNLNKMKIYYENDIDEIKIISDEEFRDIPDYEGLYQVSNLGRIKSFNYRNTGNVRIYTPHKTNSGYLRTSLSKDKISKMYLVHRLVMLTFKPDEYFEGAIINHIDCNPSNNNLNNLEWCNNSHNIQHAYDNNMISRPKGSDNKNSKLKEHQIPVIRELYKVLNNYSLIGRLFRVDSAAIRNIILYKSWKYIN